MTYTCAIDTPLGAMTAAANNDALVGLWFAGQRYHPAQAANWSREPDRPVFEALRSYLASYFLGRPDAMDVRLAPSGSPFQKTVWDILLKIPMGQVVTYGQIAGHIAQTRGLSSMSAQAVGGAVGHNPIAILIPCHRVVGSNRGLTGYAGGLDKKEALLRIEKVNLAEMDLSRPIGSFCEPRHIGR